MAKDIMLKIWMSALEGVEWIINATPWSTAVTTFANLKTKQLMICIKNEAYITVQLIMIVQKIVLPTLKHVLPVSILSSLRCHISFNQSFFSYVIKISCLWINSLVPKCDDNGYRTKKDCSQCGNAPEKCKGSCYWSYNVDTCKIKSKPNVLV